MRNEISFLKCFQEYCAMNWPAQQFHEFTSQNYTLEMKDRKKPEYDKTP